MDYQRLNNLVGWIVFAIATLVYLDTIEPTASFWDCGEFIASAYKLEVGHPPGAPLFMMLGRLFSFWGETSSELHGVVSENAGMMVNVMSGLSSSFTILFLFWTITHMARKLAIKKGEWSQDKSWITMGAGAVGALAYTFSDSFWFSAVEGEVYAMSSLFTAIVFWAILKWEDSNQTYRNRWLIFIAYMMGLSIGVHLLNLLCIPAIGFVYYYENYKVNNKGLILAGLISIGVLGVVQEGIIKWPIKLISKFELFAANSLGLPFNTGSFTFIILLVGLLAFGLWYTEKKKLPGWNTIVLAVTVIIIGYSSFALIPIRSSANPPMDENNPENAFTMLSYLNREQYGDRPLLYGHYFNSPLDNQNPYQDGNPVYWQDKEAGKYIISDDKKNSEYNYADEFESLFPRMYSAEKRHVREYKQWTDFEGKAKPYRSPQSGEVEMIAKPTMWENLKFFWKYQIQWMYGRYFMWNFAGRQNDIQGHGDKLNGNWVSGINALDSARLLDQSDLPATIDNNPAHNKFYALPLILGLIGFVFQLTQSKKDWSVVTLLFFFTGLAIVIYLNQYPRQPRERDYAYAASFYAFAVWIGLGAMAAYDGLRKYTGGKAAAAISTIVCLILVPGIMAKEGYDDHDRSHRYTARDFAKNYLDSCEPNAILFTNGDNDTFPLWYVQEVEGYRTDVRVVNLSLLNTDWYINQMKRKAYDSEPVPFLLPERKYLQGTRDYVPIFPDTRIKGHIDIKDLYEFATSDDKKRPMASGKSMNFLPTKNFRMEVDKQAVLDNGVVAPEDADRIVDAMDWVVNKSYVLKNDLMIMDLLVHNNWERPIYFAITAGSDSYFGLEDYFQLEGLAYRLVPIKSNSPDGQTGQIDTDIMYQNVMNEFQWGGMDAPKIYMDENNRRMCMNLRSNFARLAEALIREGKNDKALEVLDKCLEVMPHRNIAYDHFMVAICQSYYRLKAYDRANELAKQLFDLYSEEVLYFLDQPMQDQKHVKVDIERDIRYVLYPLVSLTGQHKQNDLNEEFKAVVDQITASASASGLGR